MLTPGRQVAIGFGAIGVPTALLYALVALWPQEAPRARFIGIEPASAADTEATTAGRAYLACLDNGAAKFGDGTSDALTVARVVQFGCEAELHRYVAASQGDASPEMQRAVEQGERDRLLSATAAVLRYRAGQRNPRITVRSLRQSAAGSRLLPDA